MSIHTRTQTSLTPHRAATPSTLHLRRDKCTPQNAFWAATTYLSAIKLPLPRANIETRPESRQINTTASQHTISTISTHRRLRHLTYTRASHAVQNADHRTPLLRPAAKGSALYPPRQERVPSSPGAACRISTSRSGGSTSKGAGCRGCLLRLGTRSVRQASPPEESRRWVI